jgi:hypothetical protein
VGHRVNLRVIRADLRVILHAGKQDTKQPYSVLAPFLAVEIFL